jgi:uncharacterized protein CbrC (UPF0167 family)
VKTLFELSPDRFLRLDDVVAATITNATVPSSPRYARSWQVRVQLRHSPAEEYFISQLGTEDYARAILHALVSAINNP